MSGPSEAIAGSHWQLTIGGAGRNLQVDGGQFATPVLRQDDNLSSFFLCCPGRWVDTLQGVHTQHRYTLFLFVGRINQRVLHPLATMQATLQTETFLAPDGFSTKGSHGICLTNGVLLVPSSKQIRFMW